MSTRTWQIIEGGLVGAATLAGTIALGFPWWLPFALFLAWDLSALGYLVGPRIGAFGYNLVHNYGVAAVAGAIAAFTSTPWLGAVALAWAFHVGVDRALGYGLKHPDSFQHTHLGWIGKGRAPGEN
jgi:hypothetical protein